MLTARVEESDKLIGLELGADDYLTKPFSPKELVARVRAVFRRTDIGPGQSDVVRAGDVTVDVRRMHAKVGNRSIELTSTEFELLAMIVLYNTFEMVPNEFAPFPGELLASAEEVSEEDSPVTILAPTEQSFNWPNKITVKDFDDWVEQRGSKFWTTWDKAYTPMISTFDKGQPPQSGGWLTATYGKGHWTYFAYALHRQLPYGVPGAFRITANLLALGKTPK